MVISQKTGKGTPWWAWVPILNFVLMIQISGYPWWWIFLLLIPALDIGIIIMVIMKIAVARNRPAWFGVLLLIPGVNMVALGILAFKDLPQN